MDFELNSPLAKYLEEMINNLPNGPKLVIQALSKKDYNKEDLSLESRVRRGELNYALCWIEALGFVQFNASGRQKLYSLTPLGRNVYEVYNDNFHQLNEEPKE